MSDLAGDIYVAWLKRVIDSLPPINLADWDMSNEREVPTVRLIDEATAPAVHDAREPGPVLWSLVIGPDVGDDQAPTDSEGEE